MRPFVSAFAYQDCIDPTLMHWQHAYYGSDQKRLTAIKREVDPHRAFECRQAIGR